LGSPSDPAGPIIAQAFVEGGPDITRSRSLMQAAPAC
jgi:hypothetical protein